MFASFPLHSLYFSQLIKLVSNIIEVLLTNKIITHFNWAVWLFDKHIHCAFKLWCRRRLLRVPWTARRSNQSVLKEISPDCSLEGLMLKLKLHYFGHLMWKADSLEKTLGKIEGRRRRGWQRMRQLDGISNLRTWVWANFGSWWWTGRPGMLHSMGSQRLGHDWATELN